MAELQELFASGLDPQKLGDIALFWSGLSIPREQRALPIASATALK
ncbi:MAG TPA: hypothetical protein VKA43_01855 [Gammaproteobacteria bacterium]|nr:hypothetical protein [Gammaproteobacteria bacterium]